MLTNHDVARVVDTVLSIPGMNESVKIDLKLSRKNVLLLNQVISRGLASEPDEKTNSLLAGMPEENLNELKSVASEILEKGGLTDLNEKLNNLTVSSKNNH